MASKQQIPAPPPPALDLGFVDEVVKQLGGGRRAGDPHPAGAASPLPLSARCGAAPGLRTHRHRARHPGRGLDVLRAVPPPADGPPSRQGLRRHRLSHPRRGGYPRVTCANTSISPMARTPTRTALFTVEKVFCVGCCTLAPVVQIDDNQLRPPDPRQGAGDVGRFPAPEERERKRRQRRRAGSNGRQPRPRVRSASASIPAVWPAVAARPMRRCRPPWRADISTPPSNASAAW